MPSTPGTRPAGRWTPAGPVAPTVLLAPTAPRAPRRYGVATGLVLTLPNPAALAAWIAQVDGVVSTSGAAAVLTTSKDRVKLQGRLDAPLAEIPIRAEPEPTFWQWLDGEVERIRKAGAP